MDRGVGPRFDATVVAVDGLMPADFGVLEALGLLIGDEQFDILAQGPLIALERQHVVGLLVDDLLGDGALAANRVEGDDGTRRRKSIFFSPNRAISTKVSAPASTASRHNSSTSASG